MIPVAQKPRVNPANTNFNQFLYPFVISHPFSSTMSILFSILLLMIFINLFGIVICLDAL